MPKKAIDFTKGILVIKSDSTFLHSIANLEFKGGQLFKVLNNFNIVELKKGTIEGDYLIANEDKGGYSIEFETLSFYNEREIEVPNKNPETLGNRYGMRFYLFLSSSIIQKISCTGIFLDKIIIELPDKYRLIFDGASVIQNNEKAQLTHSYSFEKSKYVFNWTEDVTKEFAKSKLIEIHTNIPMRFGGSAFMKLVEFPIYYFITTIVLLAVTSYLGDLKIVLGAVITAWLFMLQRWHESNLPQRNTILTTLYLRAGVILLLWALYWEFIGSTYDLKLTMSLTLCFELKKYEISIVEHTKFNWNMCLDNFNIIIPIYGILAYMIIVLLVIISMKAIKKFELTGELPNWIAVFWAKKIMAGDLKRKKFWKALEKTNNN